MTKDDIYNKLSTLNPKTLEIIDESEKHKGHAGYTESGLSHIVIKISSDLFNGITKVKQHKLVYEALSEEITSGKIHAISIKILG